MKVVSSSLMTLLVVAALLCGNCLSCPQMLASLAMHQPGHGCCHHPQPVKADCQSQGLSHFVKADSGVQAPDLAVVADRIVVTVAVAAPEVRVAASPVEWIPPDLFSLQAQFRI